MNRIAFVFSLLITLCAAEARAGVLHVESAEQAGASKATSAAAGAVALRPLRCILYVNGAYYDAVSLPQGYRATGYVQLSNVRVNLVATFTNRTVSILLRDVYNTSSRAIARIPNGIPGTDVEDIHSVVTNSGLESAAVRCYTN